jgi:hypothetical protein
MIDFESGLSSQIELLDIDVTVKLSMVVRSLKSMRTYKIDLNEIDLSPTNWIFSDATHP